VVAAAEQALADYTTPPTKIQQSLLDAPFTKAPPTGKKAFILNNQTPATLRVVDAWQEAVKSLGWTGTSLTFTTPDQAVGLTRQALAQGADFIAYIPVDYEIIKPALDMARAADVPMFSAYGTTDPEGTDNWIFANPGGPEGYVVKGKVLADWVTADSNGQANTLLVNVPSISVFKMWEEEFRKSYAETCPGCAVDSLELPYADAVSGKLVTTTVSYLRAHPDVQYVMFVLADFAVQYPAAAATAGLDKVKMVTNGTVDATFKHIADGQQQAALAGANEVVGWVLADAMARYTLGMDLDPNWEAPLPQYLHTEDNTTAETQTFTGPENYEEQFKKLWKVTS
jgi:ribose transport system substrate-binding protein